MPTDDPLTLVAYECADHIRGYLEPLSVGDELPDMPLFLNYDQHVKVPLEPTYQATWAATPFELRTAVETGVLPDPEAA